MKHSLQKTLSWRSKQHLGTTEQGQPSAFTGRKMIPPRLPGGRAQMGLCWFPARSSSYWICQSKLGLISNDCSADFNIWQKFESVSQNHHSPPVSLKKPMHRWLIRRVSQYQITQVVLPWGYCFSFCILKKKYCRIDSMATCVKLKISFQIDKYDLKVFLKIKNEWWSSFF